ncbi:MAG TPA: PIN domain-containing protein [Candidatus Dormibacteraeota bacterium]|nr:PIN domain-containing protein [Candidatus Dormibacteraeota bacterium]
MTLVIDAAPLVAVADRRDSMQQRIEALLRDEPGELVIPAPVTAEVDYLLGRRLGRVARLAFLDDLAAGRFTAVCLEADDHRVVADLERRYDDLDVGLADLSVVIVAKRSGTRRILTFDERHFRALRPLDGGQFTLLPSDAPAR